MADAEDFIGKTLYGFCSGFFGRDSYSDKVIEAIGPDWVVVRDSDGDVHFAEFRDGWQRRDMMTLLQEWSSPR